MICAEDKCRMVEGDEVCEEELVEQGQRNKRRRKRQIIWWNPPFSMNVKTNIGARFLALINKCFPKDGPLGKAFNRSNLKLSYSACPNMKQLISALGRDQGGRAGGGGEVCGLHHRL